jgi:Bacterial PH domain
LAGNKKPPSAQQLHEGCALVWLDQSGTNAQADYYELSKSLHRPTTVAVVLVKRQIPATAGLSGATQVRRRCHDACMAGDSPQEAAPASPVVITISPMAHIAVGFFALGLLIPVQTWPASAPLLIIPVLLSALIVRLRTQADDTGITVRTLLGSQSTRWEDIDGLRFNRGSWARAQLRDGRQVRLPAVTFATLPQLTQASAGRVPNPYAD